MQAVKLSLIKADDRAQPRVALFENVVRDYAEDMALGAQFPPLIVFREDAKTFWLADGFHRYHAAVGHELKEVPCEVHKGGLREAVLYSCGANATHGARRSNPDKRHVVTKLLEDKEWSHWSDREIARRCHVGHPLVAQMREDMKPPVVSGRTSTEEPERRTYRTKHGTESTQPREKKKAGAAPPEPKQQDLPLQVKQDNENAFISAGLWEIERALAKLPPPSEAARRFPTHHHHTFTTAKLREMADWMVQFAGAWSSLMEGKHGKEAKSGEKARA